MTPKRGAKPEPTKPGEPPFGLKLAPNDELLFKGKLGETITIERAITNTSPDRQCYKIKCTANDIFRVHPPLGFIERKETATIKISFVGQTVPENQKHFFAFYHTKSDKKKDGDKNPRQIWTGDTKAQGVCRQRCLFELTEGKKEEKKEEEPIPVGPFEDSMQGNLNRMNGWKRRDGEEEKKEDERKKKEDILHLRT